MARLNYKHLRHFRTAAKADGIARTELLGKR